MNPNEERPDEEARDSATAFKTYVFFVTRWGLILGFILMTLFALAMCGAV